MKRTVLEIVIAASTLVASASWAGRAPSAQSQAPEVSVGKGYRLLKLAVPADGRLGDILRKNARISGGFDVLDRRSMPAQAVRAETFTKTDWDPVAADAVILASRADNQIKLKLYDLAKGDRPVLSKGYVQADELTAANKFMNETVAYYTGEPGVFGSRIAFVRTQHTPTVRKNVFTMDMNGEAVAAITANRSLNVLPSIGPGGQVLFTSYAKRNPDLWMSAGGEPKRISTQPGLNLGGAMSPDGSTIALTLSKDGNSEIYAIDPGGNIKARLTNNDALDGSPTWSPGGNAIAFVSSRAGGAQIFRMTAGGGGVTRITRKGSYNQSPDWNPGKGNLSNLVVFAGRDASNRYDIFSIDVTSGKTTRLTQGEGRAETPTWSPDGRLVAFAYKGGIYVAQGESGQNQIEVARAASTPDWGPRAY